MVNTTSPVFLLVSSEKYLKEKAINDLRSSLLDGSSGELDYKVLYGTDTSAEEILSSASTIPFFSSKRLIVIKEFEKLSKEDVSRIVSYIKNPNQYTCLVIDTKDGNILKDDPSLARHVKILKFSDPTDTELSSWIARYASSKGKTIDEDAIEIIKELQGSDLLSLSQELEKIITFTGDRKKIVRNDIEELVGKSVMASAFDIAKAVGEKDTSKAISIVYDLISSGKRPHEVIGLLAWHFKTILKIKELVSKGETEFSILQKLGIWKKNSRSLFLQAGLYSADQLGSKLGVLLEADLGIKRAKYSPSLILEFAVIRLCLG